MKNETTALVGLSIMRQLYRLHCEIREYARNIETHTKKEMITGNYMEQSSTPHGFYTNPL